MSIVKYNFLALFQVVIALISQILVIRYFGVSEKTDAYFISQNIVNSFQLLSLLFVAMFMQYYNDIKLQSINESHKFYSSASLFSILTGLIAYLLCYLGTDYLIKIFAHNIDTNRYILVKEFLPLVAIPLICANFFSVNSALLNAEFHFAIGYIMPMLLSCLNIASIFLLGNKIGIKSIILASIASTILLFFIRIIYTRYALGIKLQFTIWNKNMIPFIRKSIAIQTGNNMHQLLKEPITTNVLSNFEAGVASHFYYAYRIMAILSTITIGPVVQIYLAKASKLLSANKIPEIKHLIKKYAMQNVLLALLCSIAAWGIAPTIIKIITSGNLPNNDIRSIQFMFLLLIPLYLANAFEPFFSSLGVAAKLSKIIIIFNSFYLLIYVVLIFSLKEILSVYVIPVSLFIAQLFNVICYTTYAFNHILDSDFICFAKRRLQMMKNLFFKEMD